MLVLCRPAAPCDGLQADVIVMVTREVESGSLKCHRYWPDPTSKASRFPHSRGSCAQVPAKSMVFDRIQVDYLETRVTMFYTVRKFRLTRDGASRCVRPAQSSNNSLTSAASSLTLRTTPGRTTACRSPAASFSSFATPFTPPAAPATRPSSSTAVLASAAPAPLLPSTG